MAMNQYVLKLYLKNQEHDLQVEWPLKMLKMSISFELIMEMK
jgi:hypothetical protein